MSRAAGVPALAAFHAPRVPRPRDALGVEAVADRRGALRRQRVRRGRVAVARVAGRGRQLAARLERGLHRVDGVVHAALVLRRQVAVADEARRTGQGAARRAGSCDQTNATARVGLDGADQLLGRRAVGVGVLGRAGADEVLVVQERAAERAHEEVVGERVATRHLPHRQRAAVVVAHRQPAGIGPGGEAVVAAAVDLHDVVVVAVDEVARHRRRTARRRRCRRARSGR